jgi:predicted AlkP superfamily phosphohydrolase/phosphomutase
MNSSSLRHSHIPAASAFRAASFRRRRWRLLTAVLACGVLAMTAQSAHAYVGPGAGLAIGGSLAVFFFSVVSAIFALLTWPIRWIIRAIRWRKAFARSRVKKFIVLGLDGLDPNMAEKYLAKGKLPNLAALRDRGCFKRLQTTVPAISPVAWSSFQTGCNPGKHNIFDFLARDRRTYAPKLSSVDTRGPSRTLKLGKFVWPLGKADIRLLRKGKPFWGVLGDHGVFSSVLRVPITFPPEKFRGVMLSGMCVPDLRGSQGMFSYYTTRANGDSQIEGEEHTGGQSIRVQREANRIQAELLGASNPLRVDGRALTCPFTVTVRSDTEAELKIGGETCLLKTGTYSDWLAAPFKAGPGVTVHGICKFLLIEAGEEFSLYVTPINIDPSSPVMPISHPAVYASYLAKRQGPFATLGLAEDSWALNEGFISDQAFIDQCTQYDGERERMFFDALDKVRHGLCVCVFDGTDRIQHTFWRELDPDHPANAKAQGPATRQHTAIEELYRRMDDLVGKVMRQIDEKTVLMVISDHGFNVFRYGIDLNRWLADNGYLKLKAGSPEELSQLKHLEAVDWSQTGAFAIGLAGIFLNLKGREAQGIVDSGQEAADLRAEIGEKLAALTDPIRSQPAIKQVYNSQETYTGPYKNDAPDLIVGYRAGYRASWETAVGQVTGEVFHDNVKAWSGDHCIDPSLVPGVLFCNRPVDAETPRLIDIGPTVLDMFGVDVPAQMDGRALKVADVAAGSGAGDE